MSSPVPVPWMSQPQSKSCTKRTPCSTSRRASRQLLANDAVARLGAVQRPDRARGSWRMSITSGTAICMRKASSYWLMRVSVSGSPNCSQLELVELAQGVEAAAADVAVHALAGC